MKDKKNLPIGRDDFKEIIDYNLYYVDKTDIIEDLLKSNSYVSLFPRPRRFGKSLFISMLDNFFNIEYKDINSNLFDGLKISKSEYYKYLNTFPVIKVDFKSITGKNYEDMYNSYKGIITKLYSDKRYLIEYLNDDEKEIYNKFLYEIADESKYKEAINLMSRYLYKYHNQKVIILIDEYDKPIQDAYVKGFYEDFIGLMKEVFSSSLKGNSNIFMGIMTGVLRVSQESLFSDLNNVSIYGIVDDEYNECFGFTTSETREILAYYDLELSEEVKKMYDGYNFCGAEIYNPWSILNYCKSKKLEEYWVNTSGNTLIFDILNKTNDDMKISVEKLLSGETLNFTYNSKVTYLDYNNFNSENNILNLLFASGYLTLDSTRIDEFGNKEMKVKLPNEEVKWLFKRILQDELIDKENITLTIIKNFSLAILNDNKEEIEIHLNKILPSMSYMDETESFYHGYILGLFSMFINQNYIIKSNREAGLGRFDLMIEKLDRSYGVIIELKITKGDMEKEAEVALNQIEEKEYYQELKLDKVKDIRKYAIVFKGKNAIVR